MLCDNCKINKASIEYTQNINNNTLHYNLCTFCYKNFEAEFLLLEIFKDFFVDFENIKNDIQCEKCGNTLNNIKNTGKMGCANCYKVFNKNILQIIKNIHFDSFHYGKVPKKFDKIDLQKEHTKKQIEDLKQKLNDAIKQENYEMAIILRDKIKKFEKEV